MYILRRNIFGGKASVWRDWFSPESSSLFWKIYSSIFFYRESSSALCSLVRFSKSKIRLSNNWFSSNDTINDKVFLHFVRIFILFLANFSKIFFAIIRWFRNERYSSFVKYSTVKWKKDEMILHERFTHTKKKKTPLEHLRFKWTVTIVGRTMNYSPLNRDSLTFTGRDVRTRSERQSRAT